MGMIGCMESFLQNVAARWFITFIGHSIRDYVTFLFLNFFFSALYLEYAVPFFIFPFYNYIFRFIALFYNNFSSFYKTNNECWIIFSSNDYNFLLIKKYLKKLKIVQKKHSQNKFFYFTIQMWILSLYSKDNKRLDVYN